MDKLRTYCSIVPIDKLDRLNALCNSINSVDNKAHFSILVLGKSGEEIPIYYHENVTYYLYNNRFYPYDFSKQYKKIRWKRAKYDALIPSFMKMLLTSGIDQCIHIDYKTYVVRSLDFIFEKLKDHSIILSPNGWPSDPTIDEEGFLKNFTEGHYSSQCIGANREGIPALDWWAQMTLSGYRKTKKKFLYDFHSYLNLIPILFEDAHILKDEGVGVSEKNINGRINMGLDEVKSIHFSEELVGLLKIYPNSFLSQYWENYKRLIKFPDSIPF